MLLAGGLTVVTMAVHAVAFALLIRVVVRRRLLASADMWHVTWSMIGLTCGLILIHLVDISIWGAFYFWQSCLPDAKGAFYFSGVTYTTLGYGDLLLPKEWRMLGPVEALTGILMCGLSTGFFFAAVSRWIGNSGQRRAASAPHSAEHGTDKSPH